ncbi:Di-sulfide bridge nucleocytoplasmic transport domain-containing protein [Melanogaster broomeanus]|nr:Di-sulfide bridge nucleocytoplasmic transport domain-containing protein [Melanogaster broomeanus]
MNSHQRSTEAPMDFQFTSRPSNNTKAIWATSNDDTSTPRKRPLNDLNLAAPTSPFPPMFGENRNVPFIFQSPPPQTNAPYPWTPPPNFSPQKAFPQPPAQELRDVDMSDVSPPKPEDSERDSGRAVATGALRRVYNSRQRTRAKSRPRNEDLEHSSEDDIEDEGGLGRPLTRNTSTHYTLNMPSAPAPRSETPYVLLGYLQFFFNLSLVLVFLYLLVQFILTVQRDVEHRIAEYSMDIVQEIGACASQYKDNFCENNQIPAMARQCAAWEACMNRDPTTVGRARIGAELIAEVVNGFVEPISWKTLVFSLTSLSFLTLFVNTMLSLYRSRHQPAHSPPSYPVAPIPPYPHAYLPLGPNSVYQKDKVDNSPEDAPRRRRLEGGQAVKVK